ncbi:MAG: hypothetical protein RI935_122 [Candidatus Parcubacteria bacterium]|jgi:hypothetical protein
MENKKNLFIFLFVFVIIAISIFFIVRKEAVSVSTLPNNVQVYTTSDGTKTITITEALSSDSVKKKILIDTLGFETNPSFIHNIDQLSVVYFEDINNDSFEELIIVNKQKESPFGAEIIAYTTASPSSLVEIASVEAKTEDPLLVPLFERYGGGDIFVIENKSLMRGFTIQEAEDESSEPSEQTTDVISENQISDTTSSSTIQNEDSKVIQKRRLLYTLNYGNGAYYFEPTLFIESSSYTTSLPASLSNTSWGWISFSDGRSLTTPDKRGSHILSFDNDTTLTLTTPCDSYSMSYFINANIIRIGTVSAKEVEPLSQSEESVTNTASSTPSTPQAEDTTRKESCAQADTPLLSRLSQMTSFVLRDTQLSLKGEAGKATLLFEKEQ